MRKNFDFFDVVVVGAGHAGIEASLASSRLGRKTLLITTNMSRIGFMSCNPSIGGLAKGHMVREIDVLGGEMGLAADSTCIQFKRLNARKGPAVRGSRAQCDKDLYSKYMAGVIQSQKDLTAVEGEVKALLLEGNKCLGVILQDGSVIKSTAVVVTTGTFMNGVMHIGTEASPGGRVGDKATTGLSDQLRSFGFDVQRLKTGTPARLRAGSINWKMTDPQPGDEVFFPFSVRGERRLVLPQVNCFLTYTTPRTHEIIRENLHLSPMYCGLIEGVGPRYCPSIEDKVVRFSDKERHQTFLEPEGLSTDSIYLQGISTSLPVEVQDKFLRTIIGLENVEVIRYGYAVEYDYIEPTQIDWSLETKGIINLYLAGQINGTSGYEEAAAQGFVAGLNAARKTLELDPIVLRRDQAYIGVLIDDLVTKGTREPYRMFTSRAEHRLNLREDNTVERLSEISGSLGILQRDVLDKMSERSRARSDIFNKLRAKKVYPTEDVQIKLSETNSSPLSKPLSFEELLRRSEICFSDLKKFGFEYESASFDLEESIEVEVKYSGYISRELELIRQAKRQEDCRIPHDIDYSRLSGLSMEEREKLLLKRPRTIGQAQRISGINPSAIQALIIHMRSRQEEGAVSNGV